MKTKSKLGPLTEKLYYRVLVAGIGPLTERLYYRVLAARTSL